MLRKIITVTIAVVMLFTMIGCGNTQATTNVSGTSEVAKGSDKSVEQTQPTQQAQPDTKEQVTKEAETEENTSIVDIGIDYSKYRASYKISIQNEEVPAITKYIKSFGEITIDVGGAIYPGNYDGWVDLPENIHNFINNRFAYHLDDYNSPHNGPSYINNRKKMTICFMLDKKENELFIMSKNG